MNLWADSRFPVESVGHFAEVRLGKMLQPQPNNPAEIEVSYLRAGHISKIEALDDLPTMFATPEDIQRYGVRPGDLVVAEGGDPGQVAFVGPSLPFPCIIQNSLHRLRSDHVDIRFLRYGLDCVYGSGWLDVLCNKSTFGHLTREKLVSLKVPLPEAALQRAIADFLDAETKKIDGLLDNRRRMRALLMERFHSYCRQESSTGQSKSLRRVSSSIQTGGTPPTDHAEYFAEPTVDWYSPGDVGDLLELRPPARLVSERAIADGYCRLFPADTTFLVGIGATAGRVAYLDHPATSNQQMTCIRTNERIRNRFLAWQLWARTDELRATAPYTTLPIITNEFIAGFILAVPHLASQDAAVRRLDAAASGLNSVYRSLEAQISLLKERRQAVITAAVTGQLPIPGAA
jgi:type I restriction enzyme, S subunit